MLPDFTTPLASSIRSAAKYLTGFARRRFQAQVAIEHCGASPRNAESVFGFNRKAVRRGLEELESNKPLRTGAERRGRPRVEDKMPALAGVADRLLATSSQADPKFQTSFAFTRMTGESLRKALAEELRIAEDDLPAARSLRRLMNRRNFSLKKVRKTIPLKKIDETDEIFANVEQAHQGASLDPSVLRISIDNKAKVKIGPFSRGGRSRKADDRNACDHDMEHCERAVPCGILEVESGQLTIGFSSNISTSDTVADNLQQWWLNRRSNYPHIKKLMIDLDNGPEVSSQRTQFMKRLVQFADQFGLEIELVYYPPYHSKYNAIERCWSALERHWNGSILGSFELVLQWARSMAWRQLRPIVRTLEGVYLRGVKTSKAQYAPIAARLCRKCSIEKWSVTISPLATEDS